MRNKDRTFSDMTLILKFYVSSILVKVTACGLFLFIIILSRHIAPKGYGRTNYL